MVIEKWINLVDGAGFIIIVSYVLTKFVVGQTWKSKGKATT